MGPSSVQLNFYLTAYDLVQYSTSTAHFLGAGLAGGREGGRARLEGTRLTDWRLADHDPDALSAFSTFRVVIVQDSFIILQKY